ncbi:MAG: fumarylacetoacetate hydrolase family protein [Acidimicrobiia bacterium]
MKLLRLGAPGEERPAVLQDEEQAADVSQYVVDYGPGFFADGGLLHLRRVMDEHGPELPKLRLVDHRIGPPIARPGKILGIGLNYEDHARESGAPLPEEPVVFMKATNTLVGPRDAVWLPRQGHKVDWEVELGVVVAGTARYLPDERAAAQLIAGYCVSNDVSERSFQLERGGQWVKGKSCETFNPLGPWLVTRDEVPDVQDLELRLSVNEELMQQGNTKAMIFGVAHLVWYLSQFMVLEPGDLITTGTPSGIGMAKSPPRFLRDGDVMELSIEGLGVQRLTCRPAP